MKNQTLAILLAALMAVFLCLAATAPVWAAHPPSCAPEDEYMWEALPRTASAYRGR